MEKNNYFFRCIVGLVVSFLTQGTLLPMDSDRLLGTKRKLGNPSEIEAKVRRTQTLRLNLIKPEQYPALLQEVIRECIEDQNQSDDEEAQLIDVSFEHQRGYYFFYGQYQDSGDSLLFKEFKSSRVPIAAYSALDGTERCLKMILKYNFPLIYSSLRKDDDAISLCKESVVKLYKIHLMPLQSNLKEVIKKIIQKFIACAEFRSLIKNFKIMSDIVELEPNTSKNEILDALKENDHYMAIIVLYPRAGKEYAQQALDMIIDLFGATEGLDVTPRFNQQISSLIYYAQGNADDKLIPGSELYFEEDFIHFKSDFTGQETDYRLAF